MNITEFMGLELWVYTASGKSIGARNGYNVPTWNISVALGSKRLFKTWASRAAGKVNIAWGSYGSHSESALLVAQSLIKNPDLFLDRVIGTHDKRTKKYKEFVIQVNEYKAWVMKKLILEEK